MQALLYSKRRCSMLVGRIRVLDVGRERFFFCSWASQVGWRGGGVEMSGGRGVGCEDILRGEVGCVLVFLGEWGGGGGHFWG